MRADLVECAAQELGQPVEREPEAEAPASPGPKAEPEGDHAEGVGVSGVAGVQWAQEAGVERERPWMVKGSGQTYLARVATVAEGAAVADAWQHVAGVVAQRSRDGSAVLRDRDTVKAMRKTVQRMVRDKSDGQAVLDLGDGLQGWVPRPDGGKAEGPR